MTALESKYKTITVICTTQDGVTVTGQTVTIRQGDSKDSPVFATAAYNGQPVTFEVPINFPYYTSVSNTLAGHFNPTTAQGNATTDKTVTLTYSDISHIVTFQDLAEAVDAGAGDTLVGLEIADTWVANDGVTSYSDPMVCVSVEQVEAPDGNKHMAAIVQRKYATLDAIQFNQTETTLATGQYQDELNYYVPDDTVTTSLHRLLVKGTDYNVGDVITGTVYVSAIKDTTAYICRYGYNRYRDSAQRQWLNSSEAAGGWWESQYYGNKAPNEANTKRGYLAGCSAALLEAAKPIKITCFTNSVTDGSVVDTMVDLMWLPSGTQMYSVVNDSEGTYWKHWKDRTGFTTPKNDANDNRKIFQLENNHTNAQYCRLRSAYRTNSYHAWYVTTSGYLTSNAASSSYRCAPACAIYNQ